MRSEFQRRPPPRQSSRRFATRSPRVDGVVVLDVSSDESHNRTVITFVAPVERAVDAAFAGIARRARQHRSHDALGRAPAHGRDGCRALHPARRHDDGAVRRARAHARRARRARSSAFPCSSTSARRRAPCARISPTFGAASSRRSARRSARRPCARRTSARRSRIATAGTVAIGARPFLVAYNVYLGDASNLGVAKEVAKAVRGSSGGLRNVKAMGLEVDGQAQVSMNLVDIEKTPMFRAYDMVKMEAAAHGVSPTWSELVGLVPERAIIDAAARYLQLRNFSTEQLLEHKVRAAASDGISLERLPRGDRVIESGAGRRQRGGARGLDRGGARADGRGADDRTKKYAEVEATVQGDRDAGGGTRAAARGARRSRRAVVRGRVGGVQAPEGDARAGDRCARPRSPRR